MIYKQRLRADIDLAREIERLIVNNLWGEFESYICYGGNALNIYNESGTRLYIRLIYEDKDKVAVDLANINIEETERRKGNLTKLINSLKGNKYISKIVISSVLSNEMHQFCKKNCMKYNKQLETYWLDIYN
ncbi:MAG: hypothetical protein J6A59_13065 [Lachnospiraceae bacterium]|nr:hypothetical protein [Lachnospiraceae bacterium]